MPAVGLVRYTNARIASGNTSHISLVLLIWAEARIARFDTSSSSSVSTDEPMRAERSGGEMGVTICVTQPNVDCEHEHYRSNCVFPVWKSFTTREHYQYERECCDESKCDCTAL